MFIHRNANLRRKTYRLTICTRIMEWKNTRIAFLGGDLRLRHTASAFAEQNADCVFWGHDDICSSLACLREPADAIRSAALVILGIPVSRDGSALNAPFSQKSLKLTELVDLLSPGQKIAMGMAPVRFKQALEKKGCICYDYNQDERFAIANALATAEGAIALAISESPDTLFDTSCAVMGFGRIAKQLCRLLTAFGAKVTVFARKESDLAYARTLGCEALPINELIKECQRFALIFNTIPMRLPPFPTENVVGTVIDLAPVYAESESPKLIRALALPYRYSPHSSGKLIYDCIAAHFSSEKEGLK